MWLPSGPRGPPVLKLSKGGDQILLGGKGGCQRRKGPKALRRDSGERRAPPDAVDKVPLRDEQGTRGRGNTQLPRSLHHPGTDTQIPEPNSLWDAETAWGRTAHVRERSRATRVSLEAEDEDGAWEQDQGALRTPRYARSPVSSLSPGFTQHACRRYSINVPEGPCSAWLTLSPSGLPS